MFGLEEVKLFDVEGPKLITQSYLVLPSFTNITYISELKKNNSVQLSRERYRVCQILVWVTEK